MKKADLILTSDWHLRETTPECRTDENYLGALMTKVWYVKKLQEEHKCPVLHAGDLFHHWKPSPYLLSLTMSYLPDQFYTIYGQHDLPQHNWQKREYSGIHALEMAGKLKVLSGTHWGQVPESSSFDIPYTRTEYRAVLVWHKMVWQGKRLWPGQTDPNSLHILKKHPEYDLILTGDNHKSFVEEHDGRLLVNPGSLSRQTAEQINYQPRIYLYYANENTVRSVDVPISKDVVSRVHIERSEDRDNRISAFIEKIDGQWEAEMNFEKNLEVYFQNNPTREEVKNIIYKSIEND
jgi:DNA repair exonuclease SbcCD nuclease subunit